MSQTFSLACRETKQKIWIGQGWDAMTIFYSGDQEVMVRLGRFLQATRGRALVLLMDDDDEEEYLEEFLDPQDGESKSALTNVSEHSLL